MKSQTAEADNHAACEHGAAKDKAAWHPLSISLVVQSPIGVAGGRQPIAVGLPIPRGRVWTPCAVSFDEPDARQTPIQATRLARWSDGSVKWLLLEFLAPPVAAGTSALNVKITPEPEDAREGQGFQVRQSPSTITVDTGAAVFEIDRKTLGPFQDVRFGARTFGGAPISRTVLTDRKGRKRRPLVEAAEIEAVGPIRATVTLAGRFDRCQGLRWRARLSFFSGTSLVQLRLTIHNPNRARHRGGLWDLGDTGSILFRDLSIELAAPSGENRRVFWKAEPKHTLQEAGGGRVEIYQDSSGGENWRSRTHVNGHGRIPCRFRGYLVTTPGAQHCGHRASPVMGVSAGGRSVAVCVPEFWQQFPKALEHDGRHLRARLFPQQWDDLFELQGGERKTHTVWLDFTPGDRGARDSLDWVHQPLRVMATPEWYSHSGVIPRLSPAAADPDQQLRTLMQDALEGEKSLPAGRETIDEYGWRNYGDLWADHEEVYYTGARPVISHYNNQFDIVQGAIFQMMRTGQMGWRDIFDPLARHVMDIDIYHTMRDKAAYNGGLFWFTDHYLDAVTSSHRTYSRANLPKDGRPYGGGPGSEHNFASGLLLYYYLTGDLDAREAVVGLADWVIRMDDGRRNLLGLADDGPTGLASLCGSPDYHGPGRGGANSIQVLLDAWTLTGREAYLEKAEELIRRCIHPDDDLESLDLLNAEKRWSYTMFLAALARYLDLKADGGHFDGMYAYARESLLVYATWMVDHERPYLDHPDELEYPTEAWAAQEFRKANVFWLAARHAPEALAEKLRERGREFSARAWRDLLSFETRTTARAIAVMMTEGTIDAYFRSQGSPQASDGRSLTCNFEPRETFVPQRARVRSQLRSASGVFHTVCRLLTPSHWKSWLFPP